MQTNPLPLFLQPPLVNVVLAFAAQTEDDLICLGHINRTCRQVCEEKWQKLPLLNEHEWHKSMHCYLVSLMLHVRPIFNELHFAACTARKQQFFEAKRVRREYVAKMAKQTLKLCQDAPFTKDAKVLPPLSMSRTLRCNIVGDDHNTNGPAEINNAMIQLFGNPHAPPFQTPVALDSHNCSLNPFLLNAASKLGPLRQHYYPNTDVTLVVFDLTIRESFFHAYTQWIPEIVFYNANQVLILVGYNSNMPWQVTLQEVEQVAQKYKCALFLTWPSVGAEPQAFACNIFRCVNMVKPASKCTIQ